jgi:hypothetical protein
MRRLIIDTDVGLDDLVAIRSLQLLGTKSDVLFTTVSGMSEAETGAMYLRRLGYNRVIKGTGMPLKNIPEWLQEHRRKLQNIVGLEEVTSSSVESRSFTDVYSFLKESADNSVTLLCLGPLSNIAYWQAEQPKLLEDKLSEIWILGGNDPNGDPIAPEFNFATDSIATNQVFHHAHTKIRLILATDTAPEKHTDVMDALKEQVKGGRGILSRIIDTDPSAACFDSMCAHLMENRTGRLETLKIFICKETGLIINDDDDDDDDDDDVIAISVARPTDVHTGYLPWIRKAIELDEQTPL